MNLRQVTSVWFSPTGQSRQVVELIRGEIPGNGGFADLTDWKTNRPDYGFTEDEAVIVGVPVYGGRVPATAVERLKKLHGNDTPAILAVTYGNRAYEDALLELRDILTEQGFRPVAGAAISAEHNIVHFAEGRPDEKDREKIREFGRKAAEILKEIYSSHEIGSLLVKGNHPYRLYGTFPIKLKVGVGCNGCGLCIKKCPVQAISRTDPKVTDESCCIGCMRCVSLCPTRSRSMGTLMKLAVRQKLKKVCAERKEPEFFYETGK